MKSLKTNNKLFYGKWPYKVEGDLIGAYAIRFSKKYFDEWVTNPKPYAYAGLDKNEVVIYRDIIESLKITMDIRVRADSKSFTVFCIDKAATDSVASILKKWAHTVYEPEDDNSLEFIKTNPTSLVLVKALPYLKYKFKVWLSPKAHIDTRQRFIKWVETYSEKIKIADATTKWLVSDSRRWFTTPYIYVDSRQTLMMVSLYLGPNIKKIEEFILKDSINTP